MLWRRSSKPFKLPPLAPVPDAETLRRVALHASWKRDRWVARRRVGLRWLLWVSGRYLMPATLALGVGAWLWLRVLPDIGNPLARLAWFEPSAPSAEVPAHVTNAGAAASPTSAPAAAMAQEAVVATGDASNEALALRLETQWAASSVDGSMSPAVTIDPQPDPLTDPLTDSTPQLKPENWLHSKEP